MAVFKVRQDELLKGREWSDTLLCKVGLMNERRTTLTARIVRVDPPAPPSPCAAMVRECGLWQRPGRSSWSIKPAQWHFQQTPDGAAWELHVRADQEPADRGLWYG